MDDSRERFEEGLAVIERLWSEDLVTHHGRFFDFDEVHLSPRAVQRPHPPVWIAAVASPESFEAAGRRGHNLMIVPFAGSLERNGELLAIYRNAWEQAGREAGACKVQVSLHLCVAESHAEAMESFKRPIARYIEVFSEAMSSWDGRTSGNYAGYAQVVAAIRAQTAEKLIEGHTALVGTPSEVAAELAYLRGLLGEFEPSLQLNFGGMTDQLAFRSLELFATQVAPRFG
jgi:alkanesulfonate monooxygenase SsuD/methylene tetrahydromethanopterin reductase-like flavin-dependent oxidoreductase (luciferase family)